MFDLDLWKEILSALKKNRMRSFMTAFGVFWGIFMLIVMSGTGRALENGVMDGIKAFASNSAFFWTEPTSKPYDGFQRGRRWNYKNTDIEYIRTHISDVEYLSPRLFGANTRDGDNTIRGKKTGAFNVFGDYPDFFKIDPWSPIKGRLINEIDIRQNRKVCNIGERVVEVMFDEEEDPIGEYIKINGVYFQVVGVVHAETRVNIGGGRKEETIIIPFTTMQKTYNHGDVVHFFSVTSDPGVPVSKVETRLKELLKERHHIAPDDLQAIGSFNIEVEWKKYTGLFTGIQLLTWIVGIGTLLAGVIGVSNIMLVIIKERTQEIGIQRAIGATPGTIITHIVAESVFLTVMAGYIGLALGVGLLELLNMALEAGAQDEVFFRNPEISFTMAVAALAVLVLSGIVAGLIPARRAVSIKPIDAIRDEGI
ncbi:MAG: ABC transporter permease [Prolixibacteraceae bacterium]|jgi:putative ABC transport system permease protein|nr:ABC transporter permease [Prolixibacteraceae bacterium]MBT6762918.1 ABC transporter permease [Prolixibacteraceae bacterium]MBT7000272.1 ABC transporter permease [Prolixibacteraceae bacterium]MBT7396658.1 ABC transporter permease [Prolixibacteraceae bacterium]